MRAASLVLGLLLMACPSGVRRPEDPRVTLAGTVYFGGADRLGDPLAGANVTVTRATDGMQLATATSSMTGGWLLAFTADPDTRVVVTFSAPGLAPTRRALTTGPFTDALLGVTLEPAELLDCVDSQCAGQSGDFTLSGAPGDSQVLARVFDPAIATPQLAGLAQLNALALAWFAVDGGADGGGADAGAPTVRLRIPFGAWSALTAELPGDGGVGLPFAAFDETSGSWSRQASAWLETEHGLRLIESAVPQVHTGMFAGGLVAAAVLPRTGYWALGSPVAPGSCLSGTILAGGGGAQGALLSIEGAEPVAAHADGSFCLPVPDGAGGLLQVQYAGLPYSLPKFSPGPGGGTCPSSCGNAGRIELTSQQLQIAALCKVSGTAVDSSGAPLSGAVVLGFDESVGGATQNTFCGKLATRCVLSSLADAAGNFSLALPVLRGVTLTASATVEAPGVIEGTRAGALRLTACPTEPVKLRLLAGGQRLEVTATLSGGALQWTPARPTVAVQATDAQGVVKWSVQSPGGLSSPVSYGQVPAGAQQVFPLSGAPAALVTGDELSVVLDGTGPDGYQFSGSAAATVP